jgi:hypothetical protein
MLGTEYSWLISISEPDSGTPRVRLANTGLVTLVVAVFCLLCVSMRAEPASRALLREATGIASAGTISSAPARSSTASAPFARPPRTP